MKMQLPIVTSCDNCGACCREQESPPMYLHYLLQMDRGELKSGDSEEWYEDCERVYRLPDELKQQLRDYGDFILREGRHPNNEVCIWFDESTLRCKHYDLRPDICRHDLNAGDEGCISWRRAYGVGSEDEVPTLLAEMIGELELID